MYYHAIQLGYFASDSTELSKAQGECRRLEQEVLDLRRDLQLCRAAAKESAEKANMATFQNQLLLDMVRAKGSSYDMVLLWFGFWFPTLVPAVGTVYPIAFFNQLICTSYPFDCIGFCLLDLPFGTPKEIEQQPTFYCFRYCQVDTA